MAAPPNPFQDGGDAYDDGGGYGGGDAYGDSGGGGADTGASGAGGGDAYGDSGQMAAQVAVNTYNQMDDSQKAAVQSAAISVATSAATSAYTESKADYQTTAAATENHNPPPEPPNWCSKCLYWYPVRFFALFGGILLIAFPFLDLFLRDNLGFVNGVVYIYLILFGIAVVFVESPSFVVTRKGQLKIFFWARIMSRMWGRAWVYLIVSFICMADFEDDVTYTGFAGVYMFVILLTMFLVSRLSANKYQRIFVFVAAGTEGDARDQKFAAKFDELDVGGSGFIDSKAIVMLATQAGRDLSNAERMTIQSFLDESCNGPVSKDDFIKQFKAHNLRQRFL